METLSQAQQIERVFLQLPPEKQARTLTRLSSLTRDAHRPKSKAQVMAEMAADPEIQREIRAINENFACADADGLDLL